MKNGKKILMVGLFLILSFTLVSCSTGIGFIDNWLGKTKGALIGQDFTISSYDDYGNKTLTVNSNKVNVGLYDNGEEAVYKSEVLEITANGNQMLQVGNTLIFAEKGLDMIEDFEVPTNINTQNGGGIVPVDRFINSFKNKLGKDKTVIISSQMGLPIGVFQGEDVYVEVPDNLPKMTRLNIDGKSLYIHRANYIIIDSKMIK